MVPVRFLVHPSVREASSATLRHLAGLAALRRLIGASAGWRVGSWKDPDRPDALYQGGAVEYDAGEYAPDLIRRKLGTYEAYPFQIWGVASEGRRKLVERLAREMDVANLQGVWVASWL